MQHIVSINFYEHATYYIQVMANKNTYLTVAQIKKNIITHTSGNTFDIHELHYISQSKK